MFSYELFQSSFITNICWDTSTTTATSSGGGVRMVTIIVVVVIVIIAYWIMIDFIIGSIVPS